MRVNLNGSWVYPSEIKAMLNGSWVDSSDHWVNVNGTWRQMVPPNAIVLYRNTSYIEEGYVASNLISSSYERLICGSPTTAGALWGATIHNASDHGSADSYHNPYIHPTYWSKGGLKTIYFHTTSSHYHSPSSHTHTGTGHNYGSSTWGLIPYIGGSKIYKDAMIFGMNTLTLSQLTYLNTYLDYLVAISSSPTALTTRTGTSHTHDAVNTAATSLYTDGWSSRGTRWENNNSIYSSHSHAEVSHSMNSTRAESINKGVIPYYVNSTIFMDQLPSGSMMFFLSDTPLSGWSRDTTYANQALRMMSSASSAYGGNTHEHPNTFLPSSGTFSGTLWNNPGRDGLASGTTSHYYVGSHSHTVTEHHAGSASNVPPSIGLIIKKKI